MNLIIYKKYNEYYLPKEVFDKFIKECKKTKNVIYGFDVFKKLKKGEVNVEIADFSKSNNPEFDYDYAIKLSDKFVEVYNGNQLLFVPIVEDETIFE